MKHVVYYPACIDSPIVAGARIARWLSKHLPVPKKDIIVLDGKSIRSWLPNGDYILYVINVPKTMIKEVEATETFVEKASCVVWIQNDYSIWAPTSSTEGMSIVTRAFTKRIQHNKPTFVWSTCQNRCIKNEKDYRYINWNALAYQPIDSFLGSRRKKILYFGSFRDGRVKEFDRYLSHDLAKETFLISAPSASARKFKERYKFGEEHMTGVLPNIPSDLTKYAATLYLEDDQSHRQYHSPANRLYEGISAGMAVLVDYKAVGTLQKAGFEVPECCIVSCCVSAREAMLRSRKIVAAQASWHTAPNTTLPHDEALKQDIKSCLREVLKCA